MYANSEFPLENIWGGFPPPPPIPPVPTPMQLFVYFLVLSFYIINY